MTRWNCGYGKNTCNCKTGQFCASFPPGGCAMNKNFPQVNSNAERRISLPIKTDFLTL